MDCLENIFTTYDAKDCKKFNQYNIETKHLQFIQTDVDLFNKIYQDILKMEMNDIIRTSSGGIAQRPENCYAFDIVRTNAYCRLTILAYGKAIAFTVGHNVQQSKDGSNITPIKAWKRFVKELALDGINIDDYKIDPAFGRIYKSQIEKPPIDILITNETIENAHHIDFHSSYPAGLCNTHPEFTPTISRIYMLRNEDEMYKAVLNYSIGCMQSLKNPWRAQWAHLAKDAINNNLIRVKALASKLKKANRKLLGYNTDGIWYQGPIFHDLNEGPNLGQWRTDHKNCIFRAKSKGAYEFKEFDEESGQWKYYPVIRGSTKLDQSKDREDWDWGDIFVEEAQEQIYKFDQNKGLILKED